MLSVAFINIYADCYFSECCYAECHYAECHYAECHRVECRYAKSGGARNYSIGSLLALLANIQLG
jgi:hypothetical protein